MFTVLLLLLALVPARLRTLTPADPNIRMAQLLNIVEARGPLEYQPNSSFFAPSHLTPVRVHGGVGP
jgi:hypothetical protein